MRCFSRPRACQALSASKHRETEDTEGHRDFSETDFYSVLLCVLGLSVFKKRWTCKTGFRLSAAAWPGRSQTSDPPRFPFTECLPACGEFLRRAARDCGFLPGGDGFGAKLASKGQERFSIAQSSRVLGEIRRRTGGGCDFSQGGDGFGAKLAHFTRAPLAEAASLREKGFGQ